MPAPDDEYQYRIFLSYDRDDAKDAARIVKRLQQQNLRPFWDRHNPAGWPFLKEIKKQIDHSHVFIALLTSQSINSTWVNHEIGYAMGRNVPIWPLSLGPLPDGMTRPLHATQAQSVQRLLPQLTRKEIERLVEHAGTAAVYECADFSDTRTAAIINHCMEVKALGDAHPQPLRHLAAFGSFCIPASSDAKEWEVRNGDPLLLPDKRDLLSQERRALEAYVERFGCDLVLFPKLQKLLPEQNQVRRGVLKKFLHTMRDVKVRVRVVFDRRGLEENLIILGDWFLVESLAPRPEGYRHTTITSHAPTVLKRIESFDRQFAEADWLPPDEAIKRLDEDFWN